MSRRASKSSMVGDQNDFYLDCKAAYLAVFDDIKDEIESKEDLVQVLQQAGRNPTSRALARYWSSNTDHLTFDDFMDICRKEKETKADDLLKAFRKIDLNGDGYISFDELYKIMNAGSDKMSRSEVKNIFDEVDENNDGRLDYGEFSKMVESTTAECKKWSKKVMEKKERKKRKDLLEKPRRGEGSIGSQTSLRSTASHKNTERPSSASVRSTTSSKMGSRSLLSVEDLPKPSPRVKSAKGKTSTVSRQKLVEPSNLREWNHQTRKGMFFLEEEDNSIISHQFTLKLKESTKVWITIQPTIYKSMAQKEGPVDTAVYIIRSKPDVKGNYLVAFSMHKDAKGRQGVKCDLEAGSYHIIPFTTGCHLKKRTVEPRNKQTLLVEKSGGGHTITSPFKAVLEEIFEMADIDANGLMCRDDFNWYNIRTNDDEVGDDEWGVVEEQLDLDDGEMTKKGFIQLNKLEAEESQGDEDDLWVTLESMGYNKNLKMDEAAPFQLDVYTEDCENAGLTVAGINPINPDSGTLLAEKAYKSVCQSVMEKGEKTKIKDMKDLHLYTYSGETRGTIIIENKSHSNVRVELDCSDSKNVITNQSSMEEMFTAKAKSQTIAYHFVPEDDSTDWSIRCTESIRK